MAEREPLAVRAWSLVQRNPRISALIGITGAIVTVRDLIALAHDVLRFVLDVAQALAALAG